MRWRIHHTHSNGDSGAITVLSLFFNLAILLLFGIFVSLSLNNSILPSSLKKIQTAHSTHGLELELSLSSVFIKQSEGVNVTALEFNTSSEPNNVTAQQEWRTSGSISGQSQVFFEKPLGLAFFQSNYNSRGISHKSPLGLFSPQLCLSEVS